MRVERTKGRAEAEAKTWLPEENLLPQPQHVAVRRFWGLGQSAKSQMLLVS